MKQIKPDRTPVFIPSETIVPAAEYILTLLRALDAVSEADSAQDKAAS